MLCRSSTVNYLFESFVCFASIISNLGREPHKFKTKVYACVFSYLPQTVYAKQVLKCRFTVEILGSGWLWLLRNTLPRAQSGLLKELLQIPKKKAFHT